MVLYVQILDVFQCVERLHELDPVSMRKLIQRERLLAVPRVDKCLPFKVDLTELLSRLPLHIIACALSQEPSPEGEPLKGIYSRSFHPFLYAWLIPAI